MKKKKLIAALIAVVTSVTSLIAQPDAIRSFKKGNSIYENGYIDQPYVVVLPDKSWLCVFTTGANHEGEGGQHVVASTSSDQGKTWSKPVDIEPSDGPAASWVMPYITSFGRVYAFYDYNGDNVSLLNGRPIRNDMLGWYCYRFSDDFGKTWSRRYRLPVRETKADRENDWKGKVQIMWGIGKPVNVGKGMMFAFTKLGKYMLDDGEGWFFRSDNINTEKDPEKLQWNLVPEGDEGLRNPAFGSVQEEQNLVEMNNGDLYCMYRTTTGYAVDAYSRDGGKNWTLPEMARYADGRPIKNPRACPRIWKCQNGKYLFWYHNHSGDNFADRNPAWISGGIEKDGKIAWSQPEVLIYDDDLTRESGRFSYPDLIEQDGKYWITSTNKLEARVVPVQNTLLEGLWKQADAATTTREGLVMELTPAGEKRHGPLTSFDLAGTFRAKSGRGYLMNTADEQAGVSVDMLLQFADLSPGQTLLNMRDESGSGLYIETSGYRQLKVVLSNGETASEWTSDPGWLDIIGPHKVSVVVDNGPNIISFIVDGKLCDGGLSRQYGWGRFDPWLGLIRLSQTVDVNPSLVKKFRIYDRPLRVSEAVAMYRNEAKTGGVSLGQQHPGTQPDREWERSKPDVVVFKPGSDTEGDNEHFLVFEAPKSNELLAIWTQSSVEGRGDNRAVFARSKNGKDWSEPVVIVGKGPGRNESQASWAFPVVSKNGRIYCFYTKELEKIDGPQMSGVLGCHYSDDNGYTWIEGKDIDVPKNKFNHPDPTVPPNWIVWQKPIRDSKGRYLAGYTQWSSESAVKRPSKNWTDHDSRARFMRFENIDANPLPQDLRITWLPKDREGLEVPHKTHPQISVSQEPAIVLLPDNRLFAIMRTMTGAIWYSVSVDDGETWRDPEALRYRDGGAVVENPLAGTPLYRLKDGRFLLFFNHNNGQKGAYNQFKKVWDNGNQLNFLRNPAFMALGEFRPAAHQPIWFSDPKKILDTEGIAYGPKGTAEVAMYISLTEKGDKRTLWYPDRKHFLLGKYLPDSLLKDMKVPK